jgi:hypothetical protein
MSDDRYYQGQGTPSPPPTRRCFSCRCFGVSYYQRALEKSPYVLIFSQCSYCGWTDEPSRAQEKS